MRTVALIFALLTVSCASQPGQGTPNATSRSSPRAHAQGSASIVTFGNSDALLCYNTARIAGIASGSLDNCHAALESRTLSRQDRIATLVNRGILFNHRGDHSAAFADFETALAMDSEVSAAYINRGNSYFLTQQYDLAIDDYSEALELNPKDPYIAHFNRGLANEAIQESELAFADFVRVTELRPGWGPAEYRVEQYRLKGFAQGN
jgi:tetratricopeptide (TPR) repeat protein